MCNKINSMQHDRVFIANSFHSWSEPINITLNDNYGTSESSIEKTVVTVKQLSKRGQRKVNLVLQFSHIHCINHRNPGIASFGLHRGS